MSSVPGQEHGINRREAIRRVSGLLGGAALIGGSSLLTACGSADDRKRADTAASGVGSFTPDDIALLDEVAETILPETATPGAKAARTGAFMALMVTDTYEPKDQEAFREGMRQLEAASQRANGVAFRQATPEQRLALLESLDREAKDYLERRDALRAARDTSKTDTSAPGGEADKFLPDQRRDNTLASDASGATALTADAPNHYFRMMKELSLLGFFTSEIGYNKVMRYMETPGRYDPCVPYTPGEPSWAPHA